MKQGLTLLGVFLGLAAVAGLGGAAKGPAVQAVEVPFELHKDAILVQAKVNGKGPFTMMLDTGVDPSVIDLATAREIGLEVEAAGHTW
jgi:predicted aspartyl protease